MPDVEYKYGKAEKKEQNTDTRDTPKSKAKTDAKGSSSSEKDA